MLKYKLRKKTSTASSLGTKILDDSLRNIIGSCNSVHGMKFVRNPRIPLGHRVLWLTILLVAMTGVLYVGLEIWSIYAQSLTATTIATTNYQYANTAFPSVTLCQSSRVDWARVDELLALANYTGEVEANIRDLLGLLSTLKYGQFTDLLRTEEFEHFQILKKLNLDRLLFQAQISCKDIFLNSQCWWRGEFLDCCEIFESQKTIYGYCLSFNSDVSESSKEKSLDYGLKDGKSYWIDAYGNPRPRRSANHGTWSGLRFTVEVPDIPPGVPAKRGLYVIITDPSNHPYEAGLFIPVNTLGDIAIWGDATEATQRVRDVPRERRSCLFSWDERKLSRGYLRENCKVQCVQDAMLRYCHCVPNFLFYILNGEEKRLVPCNLEGMLCLAKHNDYFNNYLPTKSPVHDLEKGIYCDCPDNCQSQDYISKLMISNDAQSPTQLVLDIHFESPFCTLYETDIIFGFLDALVAYGGVAGLFVGASVLSITEIIFEILVQFFKLSSQEEQSLK